MKPGDIIGHEPMGIVEEVGSEVAGLTPGDRVVVPFNISCGDCFMCSRGLQSQCETTQQRRWRKGAALFGYTHLYGGVPGGQAEYLRVPFAGYGPIRVPEGPPGERFLYLSDVLSTAWQAVEYAEIPTGGTLAVYGLGPVGQMCTRELTGGRGADSVIDAVGMEARGGPVSRALQALKLKPDIYSALRRAALSLRRGGTLSITGVYVGLLPLTPLGELFDRQFTIRVGQANVRRWSDEILPLLTEEDPLGTGDLATHRLPLDDAPRGYELFQKKQDGCVRVVLRP